MGFTDLNSPKQIAGAGGGSDSVYIDGPVTSFGDVRVATIIPQGQGDFVYSIQDRIFTTSSFAGGIVAAVSGVCELDSGTNPAGSATVQLRRGLKYRPGQGSLARITALYDTPDAGNAQFVGCGTSECGYFVGYFGTAFGVLHSETGQREIRRLDITSGSGTGDVTVTLDGYSVVVPVTGGSDTSQTAYQLSRGTYSQLGNGGWLADPIDGAIYFIAARSNATSTGSYSVSGTGIAGTFTRVKAGVAQINTFIPQSSFNIDKLDATGPTGMTLDTAKGNVLEIGYQYLGFGNANFSIEDPNTGKFRPFHIIKNANNRTTPVIKNPNMAVLATSANIGGTTNVKMKTASIGAFIEGEVRFLDPKYSRSFTFSSVNSVTYAPLAVFKVNRVFNDESCFGELDLLQIGAANTVNNKTLTVGLFLKTELTGDVDYEYVDENQSVVSYATLTPTGVGANTIANLADVSPFYELVISSDSAQTIDLEHLRYTFGLGDEVLIAIKTTASMDGQVSVTWFEQQ